MSWMDVLKVIVTCGGIAAAVAIVALAYMFIEETWL